MKYKLKPKNQLIKERESFFISSIVYLLMIVFTMSSFFAFYYSAITNKSTKVFYVICILSFIGLSFILFKNRLLKLLKI